MGNNLIMPSVSKISNVELEQSEIYSDDFSIRDLNLDEVNPFFEMRKIVFAEHIHPIVYNVDSKYNLSFYTKHILKFYQKDSTFLFKLGIKSNRNTFSQKFEQIASDMSLYVSNDSGLSSYLYITKLLQKDDKVDIEILSFVDKLNLIVEFVNKINPVNKRKLLLLKLKLIREITKMLLTLLYFKVVYKQFQEVAIIRILEFGNARIKVFSILVEKFELKIKKIPLSVEKTGTITVLNSLGNPIEVPRWHGKLKKFIEIVESKELIISNYMKGMKLFSEVTNNNIITIEDFVYRDYAHLFLQFGTVYALHNKMVDMEINIALLLLLKIQGYLFSEINELSIFPFDVSKEEYELPFKLFLSSFSSAGEFVSREKIAEATYPNIPYGVFYKIGEVYKNFKF